MIGFGDKKQKEKKKHYKDYFLFFFLYCYQRRKLHFYTRFIFFLFKCHSCFFHILALITFIFVACVPGCHKFFEPYTLGNMFLVQIVYSQDVAERFGDFVGLSAVTDFSVIYSSEKNMPLSAVPSS